MNPARAVFLDHASLDLGDLDLAPLRAQFGELVLHGRSDAEQVGERLEGAQVAISNGAPYLPFRSLSDLAGAGQGENEMGTFMNVAADNSAKVLLAFLAAWKP